MIRTVLFVLLATLLATGCSRPHAPEKDRKLKPKSDMAHDDLRRAIYAPLQRARSVQATLDDAAKSQQAQMDRDEGMPAASTTPSP